MSEVKLNDIAMGAAEGWFHGISVPRQLVEGVAKRFRAAIDSATAELRRELEEVKASRDALKREVEELRRDKERMDHLETGRHTHSCTSDAEDFSIFIAKSRTAEHGWIRPFNAATIREAVDMVMEQRATINQREK